MTNGYLIRETKDFIPIGKNKSKYQITIPIAFWPLESRKKMDEVIENMMIERPTSSFDIERVF